MKEKEIFWLDTDRKFMRQKGWKRPITDPSFFLHEKLEWMDKNNIDHEVFRDELQQIADFSTKPGRPHVCG